MVKYKALYQAMYDDLKDADMMIDYAEEIKGEHPDDALLADEFAKYAKFRLDHFANFHKLFDAEKMKYQQMDPKSLDGCLWEQTDKNMQEWHDCILKEIEHY